MRRADRGVANILVIILVAFGIGALVMGYLAQAELSRAEQETKRITGDPAHPEIVGLKDQQVEREKAATGRIKELIELAGWPREQINETEVDGVLDEMTKSRIDHLEKRKKEMGLTAPETPSVADLFAQDKTFRDGSTTMEKILQAGETRLGILKGDLQRAQHQLETAQSGAKAAADRQTAILDLKAKEAGILQNGDEATKREGVKQLSDRLAAVTDSYGQAEARKKAQLDAVKDQQKTKDKEMTDTTNRLMGEISRTIQALEEIQKKEAVVRDVTRPQGSIVNPQADGRSCYLSLGEKDGLFLGQKFRVFRKGFGGQNVWKGEIEVKRILGDSTLCSVTGLYNRADPIIEGDLIYNPLYNGGKNRVIVILGDFEGTGIGKEEFLRRVKQYGARVDEKLTWETDYVVLGANVDQGSAQYKEGALIGVPFLPIQQILQYLGD